MEEAGGWFSANLCCSALPSPGPESSSEQLAPLERKLRCLEQEKLELSRKLQGMGAIRAWAGWVCPAAGQAPQHYGCPHTAEALQTPSDHRELEQLRKEMQTLQDRLSGTPPPAPRLVPSPLTLGAELVSQHT